MLLNEKIKVIITNGLYSSDYNKCDQIIVTKISVYYDLKWRFLHVSCLH